MGVAVSELYENLADIILWTPHRLHGILQNSLWIHAEYMGECKDLHQIPVTLPCMQLVLK
jgi:hypothetical protein